MTENQVTEHKSMNTIVHAAFRRDLARFDAALAVFPAGSRQRADQLGLAWDSMRRSCTTTTSYEAQYFWPALQQTDADLSVVAHLDDEHDDMRRALEQATVFMARLRADPGAEQATAALWASRNWAKCCSHTSPTRRPTSSRSPPPTRDPRP